MQIVFRVDASSSIGIGHVMRCITLAEELRERGHKIFFLTSDHSRCATPLIEKNGFDSGTLLDDRKHNAPQEVDLLVVDHYALDVAWESKMRSVVKMIMVIDDLANRGHDCDILLDQNVLPDQNSRYVGKVPEHCRLLLGSEYVLLNSSFQRHSQSAFVRSQMQRILVFFGGGDAHNITCHTLRELRGLNIAVDVVIGSSNPNPMEVQSLCSLNGWTLHVQTQQMAELIARADLAIGAGGCSHWERCVLGLPAIVITIAENQRATSSMLSEKGACLYLGDAKNVSQGAIRSAVSSFCNTPAKLASMSQAALNVMPDAEGCPRVVDVIEDVYSTKQHQKNKKEL